MYIPLVELHSTLMNERLRIKRPLLYFDKHDWFGSVYCSRLKFVDCRPTLNLPSCLVLGPFPNIATRESWIIWKEWTLYQWGEFFPGQESILLLENCVKESIHGIVGSWFRPGTGTRFALWVEMVFGLCLILFFSLIFRRRSRAAPPRGRLRAAPRARSRRSGTPGELEKGFVTWLYEFPQSVACTGCPVLLCTTFCWLQIESSILYRVTKILGETDYVDIKMRVAFCI